MIYTCECEDRYNNMYVEYIIAPSILMAEHIMDKKPGWKSRKKCKFYKKCKVQKDYRDRDGLIHWKVLE